MAAAIELSAPVVAHAQLPGERYLLTLAAPDLARAAEPGQFAMLRCAAGWDPYLRRALPFLRTDGATVSFLFEPSDLGLSWLAGRALGASVSLLGPLGRGFALAPTTRHLLLADVGGPVAPLLALVNSAAARQLSVVLVIEGTAAAGLASIIPEAVELVTVTGGDKGALREALERLLPWADQVAVAGPEEAVRGLASLDAARRPALVQCYVAAPLVCGVGWCGSCLTETRRGTRRTCVRGPVFELNDLV